MSDPDEVQQKWVTPHKVIRDAVSDVHPGSLTPSGRDYLHEAYRVPSASLVWLVYQDAITEGSHPDYLESIAEVGVQRAIKEGSSPSVRERVESLVEELEIHAGPDSLAKITRGEPMTFQGRSAKQLVDLIMSHLEVPTYTYISDHWKEGPYE